MSYLLIKTMFFRINFYIYKQEIDLLKTNWWKKVKTFRIKVLKLQKEAFEYSLSCIFIAKTNEVISGKFKILS